MSEMWKQRHDHWDDWLNTPFRPNANEVDVFRQNTSGRSLLMGATVELIGTTTDIADINTNGIDWLDMPFDDGTFDTIISDNAPCVCGTRGPDVIRSAMKKVRVGGSVTFRMFLRNTDPELSPDIIIRKFQGLDHSFVPVQSLYDKFGDTPTTREYNGSSEVYWLPLLDELPLPSVVTYQSYPYARYFPIITWIKNEQT